MLPLCDTITAVSGVTLVDANSLDDDDRNRALSNALNFWIEENGGVFVPRVWDDREVVFSVQEGREHVGFVMIWDWMRILLVWHARVEVRYHTRDLTREAVVRLALVGRNIVRRNLDGSVRITIAIGGLL